MDGERHGTVRAVARQREVVTPGTALAHGVEGVDLRAATAAGALVRVRYGAYADAAEWAALDPAERYRRVVLAAGRRLRDPVFSHDSAAVLHGLPRLGSWPPAVHVLVGRRSGGRSTPGVRRHTVSRAAAVSAVDGLRCTTPARTVVDLARTWSFAGALVAADHALRAGLVDDAALERELERVRGERGSRQARRVLAAASPLAESVGESLSRARVHELGLPLPVLQHEVRDGGELVARVDFWWPGLRVVGEFDGRLKYRADGVADGRAAEDVVWAEKQREDQLRALGLRVVRWTWDDAWRTDPLRRALAAAGIA